MSTVSLNNAYASGQERSAVWSSLGLAFALEALVVASLLIWLAYRELPPRIVALPIEIENTPKPDQPEPPKVQPPLPKPPKNRAQADQRAPQGTSPHPSHSRA